MSLKTPAIAASAEPTSSSVTMARNALALVAGQAATMVLGILFSAILGRTLGAGDFGLYFLINSFASFALVLVDWGQQVLGFREVAKAPERAGELLGSGLVLRLVGSLLVSVPVGLTAWALGYDRRTIWFAVGFILISVPIFLAQNFAIVFRGRDRMGLDAYVLVANRAVGLVLAIAALRLGLGLGGVVVTQGLAGVAALALAFRLYRLVASGPLHFSKATARELLHGGTPLAAIAIASFIQPYIDAVLLSKLVPAEVMGWYGAAKSMMGTLIAPALILQSAAFPRLARAARSPSQLRAELVTALRPILWLGALAGVGTWLFADVAISIVYGHRQFGPAGIVLKVYGIGLGLIFVDLLISMALAAAGRARGFALVKAASVVVGVALELAFIPYFQSHAGNGGIGATLATSLSEVVVLIGGLLLMPPGTLAGAVFVDGARALACVLLTVLLFHWLPVLPPWLSIPVCIGTFSAFSVALGLVRRSDMAVLRALFSRRPAASESLPTAV